MAEGAAVDTDVLLKCAAFRLAKELGGALDGKGPPAALGLAHLIAGKQLSRMRGLRDREGAASELGALLHSLARLEPDETEIRLAADFASVAQARGLPLDAGEAQLVAITLCRGLPVLVTGDKRALSALAKLLEGDEARSLSGRLACFEQLIATIVTLIGEDAVRARVCAEPDVDGALRLACSCERNDWDPAQLHEACASFIRAVRADVGDLLIEDLALA